MYITILGSLWGESSKVVGQKVPPLPEGALERAPSGRGGTESSLEHGGTGDEMAMQLLAAAPPFDPPVWSVVPYVALLLAIAILPLTSPHFWHDLRNQA